MKDSQTKNSLDHAVPQSDAVENLTEDEKRSLELQEQADHETGVVRKDLQEKAEKKAEE